MAKRPLRTVPPAPMPARRMYSSEAAARTAAPKPGKGEHLDVTEAAPGRWAWKISAPAKPETSAAAKPKSRKRPAKARARTSRSATALAQQTSPKGDEA